MSYLDAAVRDRQPASSGERVVSPPPGDEDGTLPALEMRSITKRFPGVVALDRVDFTVRRGEIHSLIGQNGAGKSTLMNILSGVYPADTGEILIDGELVVIGHPRDALRLGIGTVYQELSLLPNLSVADNIFLGREAGNGFVVDERAIVDGARAVLERLGETRIDVAARAGNPAAGPAAGGRDRQGALARAPDSHSRRADRSPRRRGDAAPLRDPAQV